MILDKLHLFLFSNGSCGSHDSEEKILDNKTKSHVIYELLTQYVLVSLLDQRIKLLSKGDLLYFNLYHTYQSLYLNYNLL